MTRLFRSPAEKRRADIILSAKHLFLTNGFAATSMSNIARAVGGSKATLYKYFAKKEELFRAVMEDSCQKILGSIIDSTLDRDDPRSFLTMIGERFLSEIFSNEAISLNRVVIGDCIHSPEIGRYFFAAGPDRAKSEVANQLQKFTIDGLLEIGDPVKAAEDYFALLCGEAHYRIMAAVIPPPPYEEVRRHVAHVVDLMLSYWRTK